MEVKTKTVENDEVVIKFVGDSGDGMQLIGTLLSETAAQVGNDIATFPDFPAEIRAPQNTVAGVSGFQVRFGSNKINTPGDFCDFLIAMNPASLKANLKWCKLGATIILNIDSFDEKSFAKAGYTKNPLDDNSLSKYNIIPVQMNKMSKDAVGHLNLDNKSIDKSKNIFALGMVYYLFSLPIEHTINFFEKKFKKKPEIVELNKTLLKEGFNYADTIEAVNAKIYVPPSKVEKAKYRNITGNVATAWGFLAAAERSGRPLFLGSYPITPATEILMELSKYKNLGAKVLQAEDEIAGICAAIGASFTGSLALTTTSGPGLSLKSEAIGLAVMTELPLVIVDVQRAGPSTGLPTKSEQSDLYQALWGRNGECPVIVISASSPSNCFYYAYMAAKYSLEHMTPVILLTEGYIGFGSQLFKIPRVADLPSINPPIAKPNDPNYKPYNRDERLVRQWAIPGTDGLRHRIGGLEKESGIGNVSIDPQNHELMVKYRAEKVEKVADFIPEQEVEGNAEGDLLVVSWGSTYGAVNAAVVEMQNAGKKVSHAHIHYIMPLPKNIHQLFSKFKKIVVCELNAGQLVNYFRMKEPDFKYEQHNKVQGLPFNTNELTEKFNKILAN
ncbi:MAG: MFS transporter [Bacteroidetes bacterium GWA2_31_9]|nr:MAG: MFS transporter [Bacteroidetes bacterium GWA2_31_9]